MGTPMQGNDAPALGLDQSVSVRLGIVGHRGLSVAYTSPVSWASENTEVFEVIPDPEDGSRATITARGPGLCAIRASAEILVGSEPKVVVVTGLVRVTAGDPSLGYTATLEWGEPRTIAIAEAPSAPGEQTSPPSA